MASLTRVRIVVDYRPALRARTGVGEYIHQTVKALAQFSTDEVTIFTSSWADRPPPTLSTELPRARLVDRRIPVRVLNAAWHRLEWPPVEKLSGAVYFYRLQTGEFVQAKRMVLSR